MKKVFLSILLCMGVGFAMMGSPAQVGDDGNKRVGSPPVANVANDANDAFRDNGVCNINPLIKHVWSVKNLDRVLKSVPNHSLNESRAIDGRYNVKKRREIEKIEIKIKEGAAKMIEEKATSIDLMKKRQGKKPIIDVPDPPVVVGPNSLIGRVVKRAVE